MEKVVYALGRNPDEASAAFEARLCEVAAELSTRAFNVRLHLRDNAVGSGSSPVIATAGPGIDAVVQLWFDSALDEPRTPIDAILLAAAHRVESWLVSESVPLDGGPVLGGGVRQAGFSQLAFLTHPPELSWDVWRGRWQEHHTTVAIETQSTFHYVQNLVVRPLTDGSREIDAIVEEAFPIEALTDQAVYFDGAGDPARVASNQARMLESCATFIDFSGITCFPTSRYDWGGTT